MLLELLRAFAAAGLPVGLATYALVWWSLRHGYIGPTGSVREVERGFKQLAKEKKQRKRKGATPETEQPRELLAGGDSRRPAMNPVHGKWLTFGGGFYGVVGLLTYGIVELGELRDFFLGFESLSALFRQFGLNMLVGLLVDAVKNFVVAIAWPVYWLSEIRSDFIWIWFAVAYAAYWAGAKLALRRFAGSRDGPEDVDAPS